MRIGKFSIKKGTLARQGSRWGLGLFVLVLAMYAPVGGHGFVGWDDEVYITQNPQVLSGLNARSLAWAMTTFTGANWHPLTWVSHMLDIELFGLNPGAHNLANAAWHALNTLLLFVLFTFMTGRTLASAALAGLFGLHPLHVESVAWIAERKDLLAAFFGLLTLLAYAAYARRRSWLLYGVALALFALGLMAKPMLVTWPCLMLLLDMWPLGRLRLAPFSRGPLSLGRLTLEKTPFFALSLVSCLLTWLAQSSWGAVRPLAELGLGQRLANALISYLVYLFQLAWPADLAAFYPYPVAGSSTAGALGAALALGAACYLAWRWGRSRPWLAVGWLWYLGLMLPVIGLVQVGSQAHADRYTYLPVIGIFIIICWGLPELAGRVIKNRPWRVGVLTVLATAALAACFVLGVRQVAWWKNGVTLFTRAMEVTQGNYMAHYCLGNALFHAGRNQEAISHYRRALALNPRHANAANNQGNALAALGQKKEAVRAYELALSINPAHAEALYNLGVLAQGAGALGRAEAYFRQALAARPDHGLAHNNLGVVLARQGNLQAAAQEFAAALELMPGYSPAQNNLHRARLFMQRAQKARDSRP